MFKGVIGCCSKLFIFLLITIAVLLCELPYSEAATKSKKHGHNGLLEPYDGRPIPFSVSQDQINKLSKGEPVTFNERIGRSGRGVVIQDINASQLICMEKIRDLKAYPKMVPNVKKVSIYSSDSFKNGSSQIGAEFNVGALGLRFGYYLLLTHEPKYDTLTWTLDYKYNSDFDDNVGHWQVMPHPDKKGWSRVLYSTKVKLFSWIPEFIVNFLTGKALVESTSWLKREAEAEARRRPIENPTNKKWFINGGHIIKKYMEAKDLAESEIRKCNRSLRNLSFKPKLFGKFN